MTPSFRRRLLMLIAALATLGLAMAITHHLASGRYQQELREQGRTTLRLYSEIINGWISRFRALAPIYAQNPEIISALRNPEDGVQLDLVNERLTRWTWQTGAADTYLLDQHGITIAASNWDQPISFVGNDYSFRPYFTMAMNGRLGQYFALGTSSGKRGYYFSYPVRDLQRTIGVVVVKVSIEQIEAELSSAQGEVFISDRSGVIVAAGRTDWRLRTLAPLDEDERAAIARSRQFDLDKLTAIPVSALTATAPEQGALVSQQSGADGALSYLHLSRVAPIPGWELHLLQPTRSTRSQILTATLLAGSAALAVILGAIVIWQRRRRLIEQLVERQAAQERLERAVTARTADLSASNAALAREVAERIQAETDLRQTQSELIQAAKLAALGQMSTSLSHEFNQPLGAIRAYAENGVAFLDRGNLDRTRENLNRIARLTDRMAQLSKHLNGFARKPRDTVEPVNLALTIEEALALVNARVEKAGTRLSVDCPADLMVMGGQIRLQHVLINLVSNAIDACEGTEQPQIAITATRQSAEGESRDANGAEERILLRVEDNGPGLSAQVLEKLFDPFFSTKETGKGLGLGLSISYNIVKDFGGHLWAENRMDGGARFSISLRQARPAQQPQPIGELS
ncbi:MAG: ATP-binding protein [Neomegalonema sp.]|nr:ATP-binding protein [Neomegalonema sp.]